MREKRELDQGWKFYLGDLSPKTDSEEWGAAKAKAFHFGAAALDFDDDGWRSINLPHDFVMEGDYTRKQGKFEGGTNIPAMETIDNRHVAGGCLDGGIGWYRKTFQIDKACEGRRIYLHFGGVFRNSTVYLNEYDIGNHVSGYTGFYYDVTDVVNYGEKNLLAVRVDATGREGWWYEGGGIYRHVWLEIADAVHARPWGISVEASPCQDAEGNYADADIRVETQIISRSLRQECAVLESSVYDADGGLIRSAREEVSLEGWSGSTVVQHIEMEHPRLWDLDDPYCYRLQTIIYIGGQAVDVTDTHFGVRDIRFDADRGFYLNGRSVKIKGVCCHQDHAGTGIGMPDSIFEYRLKKLKDMGCNAYRCAHHAPAQALLDLCDRMGILVMGEVRKMGSTQETLKQLKDTVMRDRNHPCIIMWSVGNEEVFAQDRPEAPRIIRSMREEIRRLDRVRPITMAFCAWNGKDQLPSSEVFLPGARELDIMGFNYADREWDHFHEMAPKQPFIVTEASANSCTRGAYHTDPKTSQYYIMDPGNTGRFQKKDAAEKQWKMTADRDYISGLFIWTGFDYRGEPTPLTYPAVSSQFGVMDYCGFPKDNYYYYKSWWAEEPVLHIFPHWNWPGREGQAVAVYCYSNLEEVELFVNGVSQGRKRMEENWYLEWPDVIYEPGSLSARGYAGGREVLFKEVRTTGAPYKICLVPDRTELRAGGADVAAIAAKILDQENNVVPYAENLLTFEVTGCGAFLGCGNGDPGSHESDKVPARRAFHGLCQLLVESGQDEGTIYVKVSANGLVPAECSIEVHK